ncbi:MAG: L,D-transpeptidase family protein [Rhizobiales bacterium]|nr:L,D-transpeptidase family protein [Hyphomicrobiales bacterium]
MTHFIKPLSFLVILLLAATAGGSAVRAQDALGDGGAGPGDGEALIDNIVVVDASADELVPEDELPAAVFLRIEYDEGDLYGGDVSERLTDLFEFYDARLYEPIWVTETGPNQRARALIDALIDAERHALYPGNYDIGTIALLLGVTTPTALADFEMRLSKALLDYGRDLSAGRVEPSEVDSELAIFPEGPSAAELLTGVLNSPEPAGYLASLAPASPNYARLQQKLDEYRAAAAMGEWTKVPEDEVLKPGMNQARVPVLRQRLAQSGHYDPASAPPPAPGAETVYDDALVAAVELFQQRHGLDVDGVVGPGTLAALNVPLADRVRQMELNMERRRWMEDDLGENYVFVNLADFELKVVKGPKTVHTARVVIGKPYHRTPVFSETMKYIEINPYWNVPRSIAGNELLPKLKNDPGSLKRDGIRIFSSYASDAYEVDPWSVNWHGYSAKGFPFRLRQDSGDGNALGRIKFMFPNRFNVYLHDTPSKSLFARAVRSFSHGCVRVQNPRDFGAVLLAEQGWSREEIDGVVASGERKVVNLERPIRVHITYLTAWVNKDGSVHFRDDIYGRDETLAKALERSLRGSV